MNAKTLALVTLTSSVIALSVLPGFVCAADDKNTAELSEENVKKLIVDLSTKRTPNIYGAVYYPKWKKHMDGLKSITAEEIAEHASEQLKEGVELEVVAKPITVGSAGGVLLRRSGSKFKDAVVPVYLFRDGRGDWTFPALPIPYKAPRLRGRDGKFMEKALNSEQPYNGPLYEFDDDTKKDFEKIRARLEALQKTVAKAAGDDARLEEPQKSAEPDPTRK